MGKPEAREATAVEVVDRVVMEVGTAWGVVVAFEGFEVGAGRAGRAGKGY